MIFFNIPMAYFDGFTLEERWYTKAEIKTLIDAATIKSNYQANREQYYSQAINGLDAAFTEFTASISGNTLALTNSDGTETPYIRK